MIDNLPWSIYCGPDFDDFIAFQATKAHRVAILRALEGMDLGDWQHFHEGEAWNQSVLVNRASVLSMATIKCNRDAVIDGRRGMSCQMWPTYHKQVIPIIREVNDYLAKTGRPPWKVSDMPEKFRPKGFDHRLRLEPRQRAALEAELAELMEGKADAVPAEQRDPDALDELAKLYADMRAEAERKARAARLAKAIALVEAAGLVVIDPKLGHNGGGSSFADAAA